MNKVEYLDIFFKLKLKISIKYMHVVLKNKTYGPAESKIVIPPLQAWSAWMPLIAFRL